MNSIQSSGPLVSVAIPTYNRPEGLRRTLDCICNQTYKNLEIIVSDNCTDGDEVKDVVDEFSMRDSRIVFHRQKKNIGAVKNYQFLLKISTGKYFMWAADDDEWDPRFVEICLENSEGVSAVMTATCLVNRFSNTEDPVELPDISPDYTIYQNLRNHLLKLTPNLIYALHKRDDILWFSNYEVFDFFDCYLTSELLVNGNGFRLVNDFVGYKIGIDSENYLLKPASPKKRQNFSYRPFFDRHIQLLRASKDINLLEKLLLAENVLFTTMLFFSHHERDKSILAKLTRPFVKFRKALWKIRESF
jgi:glycosyltransferase involved in cell wall biosynthesis